MEIETDLLSLPLSTYLLWGCLGRRWKSDDEVMTLNSQIHLESYPEGELFNSALMDWDE